jgi:hypothetical protein
MSRRRAARVCGVERDRGGSPLRALPWPASDACVSYTHPFAITVWGLDHVVERGTIADGSGQSTLERGSSRSRLDRQLDEDA